LIGTEEQWDEGRKRPLELRYQEGPCEPQESSELYSSEVEAFGESGARERHDPIYTLKRSPLAALWLGD
jgi:hypothetical protein